MKTFKLFSTLMVFFMLVNLSFAQNVLGVLDEYEKVYENLKTYDPMYPTADYLRLYAYRRVIINVE